MLHQLLGDSDDPFVTIDRDEEALERDIRSGAVDRAALPSRAAFLRQPLAHAAMTSAEVTREHYDAVCYGGRDITGFLRRRRPPSVRLQYEVWRSPPFANTGLP